MRLAEVLNHTFLFDPLREARVILDCGANQGGFSQWASEHTQASIEAFEPDPRLYRLLPRLPRVTYHPLAVDGFSGEIDLALGERACSSAVYRETTRQEIVRVCATFLDDFCRRQALGEIDLLKLDIEGAELSTLENASEELLQSTKQITVEFHDFLNRSDVTRIRRICTRLEGLGFVLFKFTCHTWGDCLFVNRQHLNLTLAQQCGLRAEKYRRGACRVIRRVL